MKKFLLLLFALLVFVGIRFLPFLWTQMPFGFDVGMYRYGFLQAADVATFAPQLGIGYWGYLLSRTGIISFLGLDAFLFGSYAFFQLLLMGVLAAVLSRRGSWRSAVIGVLLLAFSVLQWKAYGAFYYKQLFGLSWLLLFCVFYERKSWWSLLCWVLSAFIVPLETFLLSASVFLSLFFEGRRKRVKKEEFVAGFVFLLTAAVLGFLTAEYWSWAWQLFLDGLFFRSRLEPSLVTGSFVSWESFVTWALPFLVFGFLGLCQSFRKEGVTHWNLFPVLLFVWCFVRLFFYQRLFITLEFFLLFFAAQYLGSFVDGLRRKERRLFLSIFALLMVIPFSFFLVNYRVTISSEEFSALQEYCSDLEVGEIVVVTDSARAGWVRGWCLEQQVIAPGIFEGDIWARPQWEDFWTQPDRFVGELVDVYGKKLSFFQSGQQLSVPYGSRFEQINKYWYRLVD